MDFTQETSSRDLESLDENMSFTEPCFYQRGNERAFWFMSSGTNYMAKHSSKISNPSKPIPSLSSGLKTLFAKEVPKQGMSLHPRLVHGTLSKS